LMGPSCGSAAEEEEVSWALMNAGANIAREMS
jgi:hypothetical protein